MITPKEIKAKAERKYNAFLESLIKGEPFSELVIRGDKSYTKNSSQEFQKEIQLIIGESKEKKGFGYSLTYQKVKTKFLGIQDLPTSIYFESERDYLKFLGVEDEVKHFKSNVEKTLNVFPEVKNWMLKFPKKIIQKENEWDDILKVCAYFQENPKPRVYIRELPIKVHTKFIEKNNSIIGELLQIIISEHINPGEKEFEKIFNLKFSEPLIRFKVLDKKISQEYFSGIDDLAIPISQFEALNLPIKKVVIVENKTTLYTTLALPNMEDTIAVFGSGYSVTNLKNVEWFKSTSILYWGDIDAQGFEILSQFRNYFPQTESVLMNKEIFDQYYEGDLGVETKVNVPLNLTASEQELYEVLKANNYRLEQEKIPIEAIMNYFDRG